MVGFLRPLVEAWLEGRQEPSRPATRIAKAYQWRCPCGAHGQGFGANQHDIEYNAYQHRARMDVSHLPYVTDQFGNVVSRLIPNPSGSVGRHWGWTD